MDFTIRPSTGADLAAIDALLARSFPKLLKADYPPSVLAAALPLLVRAQPALLSSGTYYVAEDAGERILGAGGWTPDRRCAGLGHVRHVATDDRALRRGVGRRIVAHALEQARARGVADMECWATRTAVPFYAALGFAEIGPIAVDLTPGIAFPSVRMTRRLSSPRRCG